MVVVGFAALLGQANIATAQLSQSHLENAEYIKDTLPEYAELGTQTFNGLGASPSNGEISGIPGDLLDDIGYDPGRSWNAGTPISDILTLGDIGNSFYGQAMSLSEISNITGVNTAATGLTDFRVIQNQTFGSLSSIAGLDNFKLQDVAPFQSVFNQAVTPGLAEIATQTGDLVNFDPQNWIDNTLADYGNETIGNLVGTPDLLSEGVFGDLSFGGESFDVLKDYSIGDIPGLDQAKLGEFAGWEDLSISEVPGLGDVPFGDFPNPIASITGGFGGTHDVTYGPKEHTVTPTKFSITGSDQEGFNVQCAQSKGCMYLELEGPGAMHGAQWIAGGSGEGQQIVKGGRGILGAINGGKEPTGRVPFGDVFKIVLTGVNESDGSGDFALYMRYCQKTMFVDLGCTPYFIGPIPIWSTSEKGFVLTGPLDGQGGATGGMQVPPELQQYASKNLGAPGGGTYHGGGSPIQMDDDCLDALIGALRHSNEATNAREHIPRIINAANEHGVTDKAQIAYILSTISTELEGIWEPVTEFGVSCNQYEAEGCYIGRGFVQLTWKENYEKLGNVLGVDLVNNPDLALDPDIAAQVTVVGMRDGLFTGVGLSDYIGGGSADFINARRIINDNDKMSFTAQQAERFLTALNSCSTLETTTGPAAGDINAAIIDSVNRNTGMSSANIPGTNGGKLACAGTVNYILHDAGIATLGGGPPYGSLAVLGIEDAILGGRGVQVSEAEAQPGDLNIIDMGNKGHIGICLNVGCTQVISNSSSRASFAWESDGWFTPSYGGGRRAIYRVTN
ncbi:MAG: glycoside hydrolase family 19 protein [Cyanobacteria bacterium P01_H01_bin.152]